MFKKTMKLDDLNGDEVTQTFYFNYNKKEIAELIEFKDLEGKLALLSLPVEESGLTQQQNNQQAYDIFQDLILDAYGQKGADNVTFLKTPALREYWGSHVAFVEMIFEFLENPQLAAQFIENCLPTKLVSQAKAEMVRESQGKISEGTLTEMVAEADRRQKDPATRIEPGPQTPEQVQFAQDLSQPVKATPLEEMTPEDIIAMDDVAFAKLDPQRLSKEQLSAAFRRKLS